MSQQAFYADASLDDLGLVLLVLRLAVYAPVFFKVIHVDLQNLTLTQHLACAGSLPGEGRGGVRLECDARQ